MRDELIMVCDPQGNPRKLLQLDIEKVKKSKEPVDDLKKVFETKRHPYHMSRIATRTPMNDPDLFIVFFQRVL